MLRKLDSAYYQVERGVVVLCLAMMSAAVALDVIYRRLVAEYSLAGQLAAALTTYVLLLFAARTARARPAAVWALVCLLLLFGLTRLMLHTRSAWTYIALVAGGAVVLGRSLPTWPRAVAALGTGVICLLLWKLTPEGFSWSKEVALVLLLWVGFLGGSLATYDRRHITIDFIRKLVPAGARNPYETLSHLLAASFTAFLTFLSWRYVFGADVGLFHFGGRFDHSGIPTWLGVCAVPLGFFSMTLRFLGHAIAASRGRLPEVATGQG